jgi:hypothetical protein
MEDKTSPVGFFAVSKMQMHKLIMYSWKKLWVLIFCWNFRDAPHGAAHDHCIVPFFDRMRIYGAWCGPFPMSPCIGETQKLMVCFCHSHRMNRSSQPREDDHVLTMGKVLPRFPLLSKAEVQPCLKKCYIFFMSDFFKILYFLSVQLREDPG